MLSYLKKQAQKYPELSKLSSAVASLQTPITGRFDIKNFCGQGHKIVVLMNSDNKADIQTPDWFVDDTGIGTVIHSAEQRIRVIFQCIGDGELKVILRSKDVRDNQNNRIPIVIRYKQLQINGKNVFATPHDIWHDYPFTFTKRVKNGEIVELFSEWEADEMASLRETLSQSQSSLQAAYSTLEKQFHQLSDEKKALDAYLQRVSDEKNALNVTLQQTYAEKSEINATLQRTYAEKSEINAKLQQTYAEKAERGLRIKELESALKTEKKRLTAEKKKNEKLKKSFSYRVGRVITWPFRKVKHLLRRVTESA